MGNTQKAPMTYGRYKATRRTSYLARGSRARASKVAFKRAANKPVARIQRKRYVPQRVKNTSSIRVLAKQVKSLQRSQVGRVQSKIQSWRIPQVVLSSWDTVSFWRGAPIAFALNDFTDQANVYMAHEHLDSTGQTASATTIYNKHPWSSFNGLNHTGSINDSSMTYLKDNSYWRTQQDNTVSAEYYLPLSSDVMFEFSRQMTPLEETECIRIDIVKPKKFHVQSVYSQLTLPAGLIGLQNLAAKTMFERNKLNPRYFTVVKTKFLYFKNSASTAANTDRRKITRTFRFRTRFPDKVMALDLNAHNTVPTGQGQTVDNADFIDLVNPKDVHWCLISTSQPSFNDTKWDMSMMRTIRWRDPHGTD